MSTKKVNVELYEQLRSAYAQEYTPKRGKFSGPFKILPQSPGDNLGNYQQMLKVDHAGKVSELMKELEMTGESAILNTRLETLSILRSTAEQRNRILRRQVIPPEELRQVWNWLPGKGEGWANDPMINELPQPMLEELFNEVAKVTAGAYLLTDDGSAAVESAAGK